MTQAEWAARVAEIGALAGWGERKVAQFAEPREITFLLFDRMAYDLYMPDRDAVIAAIRQLCADWLASEGVKASRWQELDGIDYVTKPQRRGPSGQYEVAK